MGAATTDNKLNAAFSMQERKAQVFFTSDIIAKSIPESFPESVTGSFPFLRGFHGSLLLYSPGGTNPAFSAFILCGSTYFDWIYVLWHPIYRSTPDVGLQRRIDRCVFSPGTWSNDPYRAGAFIVYAFSGRKYLEARMHPDWHGPATSCR